MKRLQNNHLKFAKLHHRPGAIKPGAVLYQTTHLFPNDDGDLGWFDHCHRRSQAATGHHGHPILRRDSRVQYVRGNPLHPRVMVYRKRTWQTQRHFHGIRSGWHHVWRIYPDWYSLEYERCERSCWLALAVHRESTLPIRQTYFCLPILT